MPQIFKALATVGIWGLYIGSWLWGLLTFIKGITLGYMFGTGVPPMAYFAGGAICIGFAFAAGFMMLVRKKLE